MENPWEQLPDHPPFFLPEDQEQIEEFNRRHPAPFQILPDLLPEPYIGDPQKAQIIILTLNPGFDKSDRDFHERPDFRQEVRKNLLHHSADMEYPLYYYNPKFAKSGGAYYWNKVLHEWIEVFRTKEGLTVEGARRRLSQRVAIIEWFAYHSRRFRELPSLLPGQSYAHHLAHQAVKQGKIVIVHRAYARWVHAVGDSDKLITHVRGTPPRNWHLRSVFLQPHFARITQALLDSGHY